MSKYFAWSKALHSLLVIYGVSLSCQAGKSIVWEELPLGLSDGDLLISMASMLQLEIQTHDLFAPGCSVLFLEDLINADLPLQCSKSMVNQYFLVFVYDSNINFWVHFYLLLYQHFTFNVSESVVCTMTQWFFFRILFQSDFK